MIQVCMYIYLESHKDEHFCPYGFEHLFCPLRFFPNKGMSSCKPSTCRSIVFLKSWICRSSSGSMSVSSGHSIWGSMLTCVYCFFATWCWTKILVFYGYTGTPKFGGKYGSICGQIWVPGHDSQLAPCWSSFGDCRRISEPGVIKGFEQPFTVKN